MENQRLGGPLLQNPALHGAGLPRLNRARWSTADQPYLRSDHYVAGLEYVPTRILRFTLEGFLQTIRRLSGECIRRRFRWPTAAAAFGILGNERVLATGTGEAYGLELFAQQKLNNNLYFTGSYTLFWSRFSNADSQKIASAWDNRHLLSLLAGYKLGRNWEVGVKYRLQGGVPYTPLDLEASRLNYATIGTGVLDNSRLNSLRLGNFSQLDLRIDKKWNFRRFTLDVFSGHPERAEHGESRTAGLHISAHPRWEIVRYHRWPAPACRCRQCHPPAARKHGRFVVAECGHCGGVLA
jgi:hypothetical protein